jgi:hypothetical protein
MRPRCTRLEVLHVGRPQGRLHRRPGKDRAHRGHPMSGLDAFLVLAIAAGVVFVGLMALRYGPL